MMLYSKYIFLILPVVFAPCSWFALGLPIQPSNEGQELLRKLSISFGDMPSECRNVNTAISRAPSAVLRNLTDPSVYDMKQRPNTAPVNHGLYKGRVPVTTPDNVTYSQLISSVDRVDMFNQEIVLSVFEMITWHDPRLSYNMENEASCCTGTGNSLFSYIHLADRDIEGDYEILWKPDMYIVNSRSDAIKGDMITFILEDGSVFMVNQKTLTISCPMHFGQYPYTTLKCEVHASTFGHSSDEIKLNHEPIPYFKASKHMIDLNVFMESNEVNAFKISRDTSSRIENEELLKEDMYGSITLTHHPGSLWESLFIPDMLLHIAISSSFWIDSRAAPARVTVCVISIMTFRVLMSSLYTELPPVSYSLWIIDYMVASQVMAVMALCYYALIQYFLNTEESRSYVLASLSASNVLQALDSSKMSASELFLLAIEKHNSFSKTSQGIKEREIQSNKSYIISKFSKGNKSREKVTPDTRDMGVKRLGDRGSSVTRLNSVEVLSDFKLGINDVLNLIIVRDVFNAFDIRKEGAISVVEFHFALRYFGLFYSHMQVCAMLENFWQEQGSVLEHHLDIDLETFLRVLISYKRFEPVRDLNMGVRYQKPSMIADTFARVAYPLSFVLRSFVFYIKLGSY